MLLVAGGAVAVVHTLAIVAFCFFAATSVARVIAGESLEALAVPIVATAVSILVRAGSQAALDAIAVRGAVRVKAQLRERALDALDAGGPELLARHPSARLAVLLGQGLDAMDGYVGSYLPQLVLSVVATPIVVLALLAGDLASGIAVIVTLPLIPVFMVLIGLATRAMQRQQWDALGELAQGFSEVVEGLSTLMLFGRQHRQEGRIRQVTADYRRRTMAVLRLSFLSGFALELAASLSVAVVAVSVGVRLIDGDITLALGLFVLMLVPEAYVPLRRVGAQYHAAADGIVAADDVLALLDEAGAHADRAQPAGDREPAARDSAPALRVHGLTVERDGQTVVRDAEFDVPAGSLVAIMGASGAGKSTLAAAILDFVDPVTGVIEVGGASANRRDRLAWAPQTARLVGATVADAVALGDPQPDRDRVLRALATAAADDIDPDASLDARGQGLSGGQVQRVAIARALYRAERIDAALVLLDEPTSALDEATEARVLDGLRTLAAADAGRGVLVITHRPAVAQVADAVVTLDASLTAAGVTR